MDRFSENKQKKLSYSYLAKLHRPHFRLISLFTYLAFILIFNLVIAPSFGIGGKAYAFSNIDSNRLVDLANQDRAQNGNLSPLTIDQRLVNAATNKAIDMFKKQYWAHYGPNGETPWQFIVAQGYNYSYAGENLAKDFSDTDSVNTAWMNSATHKANILNSNYKNIGIAAISGKQICNGTYPGFTDNDLSTCIDTVIVVQMFGTSTTSGSSGSIVTSTPKVTSIPKTATPVPTTVPQAPSKPIISYPQNDSMINQNKISIKGTTDKGTSVSVYEGDKKLGTITSDDGAFDVKDITLEEGKHSVKATATNPNNLASLSDDTNFNIDTTKPEFSNNDVKIQLNDINSNDYYIEGEFPEDTVSVTAASGTSNINLEKQGDTFVGYIKIPLGNVGVVLSVTDKAGNEFSKNINIPDVPIGSGGLFTKKDIGSDSSGINNLNAKQTINIVIGILILLIFLADSFLVWRTGRHLSPENLKRHKNILSKEKGSLLHHIMPIIIVVVSLTLTFSGQVL